MEYDKKTIVGLLVILSIFAYAAFRLGFPIWQIFATICISVFIWDRFYINRKPNPRA